MKILLPAVAVALVAATALLSSPSARPQGHGTAIFKPLPSYEATLVAPDPFEAYLNGDDTAIDPSETRSGPFYGKGLLLLPFRCQYWRGRLYPFGLVEKPGADILPENDKGRFAVTNVPEDPMFSACHRCAT